MMPGKRQRIVEAVARITGAKVEVKSFAQANKERRKLQEENDSRDAMLDSFESRLGEMESQIIGIEKQLQSLQGIGSVTKTEIATVSNQITTVSNQVTTVSNQVTTLSTAEATHYLDLANRIFELKTLVSQASRYSNVELASILANEQNTSRPLILLAGFYGANNYGDELMLRTILQFFPESIMSQVYVLLCDVFEYDKRELPAGVHWVHYPKSMWDIDALADIFDVVVWGGGAILDENQYDNAPLNTNTGNIFVQLNQKMLARDKDVYCVGLSANDVVRSREWADAIRGIAMGARHFSLRDPNSFETLVRNGVDETCLKKCEDIVFANQAFSEPFEYSKNGPVGLALICVEALYETDVSIVNKLVNMLTRQGDEREVILIPSFDNQHHDITFLNRILQQVDEKCVRVAPYVNSITGNEITQCSLILSARYHASLVANTLGIPTLTICWYQHPHYPNKMRHLVRMFGRSNLVSQEFLGSCTEDLFRECVLSVASPIIDEAMLVKQRTYLHEICLRVMNERSRG